MSFAYTDMDKIRITEAVSGHSDFLNVKDCKHQFRELERLKHKTISYDLHLRTLSEYVKVQRIPRGLRVCLCPTLFSQEQEFREKWESIINKCSNDLMLLTMERLQKELPELACAADGEMDAIRTSFPADAVTEGTEKLADHLDKFRAEVEVRKRIKFQRDTMDYTTGRVYRWVHSSHSASPNQRPPRMSVPRGDERSDHSHSTSASSTSSLFLGGSQATGGTL
ncbi:hypothetical protein XELAEV_18033230mg, partial [Xenopus laevis]